MKYSVLGFCHVHLVLKRYYFHWGVDTGERKEWEKKSDKIYWNSSASTILPIAKINNVCPNNYSYRSIDIVLMRRAWCMWKKCPSGFLLLVRWDEFVESGLAARYFCGIWSVGASCPSRPHQRDLDCGFLGLECVYHNYLMLHSQPLDRQGCRSESKQRKHNRSPFFPLKKLKGWFRSELTLGVKSHLVRMTSERQQHVAPRSS